MTTDVKKLIFVFSLVLSSHFLVLTSACAELLDRVVAIVDDEAVMFSELNEAYQKALSSKTGATQEEVLNCLINRVLLLKQAKKFTHSIQTRNDYDENT